MKGLDTDSPWINTWRSIGLIGDAVNSRSVQRYESLDTLNTDGGYEAILDKWTNSVSKYSGLVPLTDALKTLSLGSGYDWLIRISKQDGISKADQKRIYRMGLDENDLATLRKVNENTVEYKNGQLHDFKFEEWDEAFAEKIQDALMEHIESTVLHPDGAAIPAWFSDPNNPIAKILFQFMRFPIAAHERLALKGLTEFDRKQTIGIAANMALFTLLSQIKDLGNPNPRFDLSTEEGQANIMQYLLTNNYGSGPILSMMEKALTLGTGHQPFSTWNQGVGALFGVSGATIGAGQRTASALLDADVQAALENVRKLLPTHSVPFIRYQIEPLIEEAFNE